MRTAYNPFNDNGITLVEVLIATIILAVAIVPMVNAFRSATTSTGVGERLVVFTTQAGSTLNRTLALDYDTLKNNLGDHVNLADLFGSASEADREKFTFGGSDYIPAISIADASSGTGGLLEIKVTIEEITLKTLKSSY
ncbi:hypothetical protein JY97_02800 [Alkalispirochaeta odontotermitis]|nr:hypothetical protein JY97_02800 [Alkalispirochaeta odontotermitis]CAB1083181.1 hypothetical protein D1AOALGA4SA_10760 [Olavius algarvensis Delta 1 endosymbiont]